MPVATPTIAIADNADGTGCVCTVTTSTAGTTNTLYSQAVDGELGGSTWTSRGSRTGDGTIAVSITTPAYFWWKLVSTDGSTADVSNLVYQNVTDGDDAIHSRLIDSVLARVQGLTFAANAAGATISTSDIVKRKLVTDLAEHRPDMPCIVIGLTGKERVNKTGGTNNRDEVVYPIAVVLFAADNKDLVANLEWYLKIREQIFKACNNYRPAGVEECLTIDVETDPILPLGPWLQNLAACSLILQCRVWQVRGVT